jgi:hypothetical protein
MTENQYIVKLFRTRENADAAQEIAERRIQLALSRAYDDLVRLLRLNSEDTVTRQLLLAKKAAMEERIYSLAVELNTANRLGIRRAAEDVTKTYTGITREFASSKGFALGHDFTRVPIEATRAVLGRVWADGQKYSDRVWRVSELAQNGVKDIVTAGVARGQSAVDMSKNLQRFLLDPQISDATSWTTGIRPSVTGRGTVHYNALRLARTEINNSYREALVQSNADNPITLGVKWNLSGSHTVPDVCDIWAKSDQYGIGKGVYPAKAAPLDHPNGRCFLTDVLRAAKDWSSEKPQYQSRNLSDAELLKPLQKLPEYQRNAAIASWQKVNQTISTELSAYRKAA